MRQAIIFSLIACSILTYSCTPIYQVYEVKANPPIENQKDTYIFENDTVRIMYSFWAPHGKLSFSIYNKLSTPIYVDWKKSSCVYNNQKLDYWKDVAVSRESASSQSESYFGKLYGLYYNTGTTIRPEQITFIAPKSIIQKDQYLLFPAKGTNLTNGSVRDEPRKDNERKKIQVKYTEYTENTSPLVFRNFLTLSTSDKFEKEMYLDNGFYLWRVSEMDKANFVDVEAYPYQKETSFYIVVKE